MAHQRTSSLCGWLMVLTAVLGLPGAACAQVSTLPGGWPLSGACDLPPQRFTVEHRLPGAKPDEPDAVYRARLTLQPRIEARRDGVLRVVLDDSHVTLESLERRDPPEPALAGWKRKLAPLAFPYQRVEAIRATFDRGEAAWTGSAEPYYSLRVPQGATRLRCLEVTWRWRDQRAELMYGEPEGWRQSAPLGLVGAFAGLLVGGCLPALSRGLRTRGLRKEGRAL